MTTTNILLDFTSLTSQHYKAAECTQITLHESLRLKPTRRSNSNSNSNVNSKSNDHKVKDASDATNGNHYNNNHSSSSTHPGGEDHSISEEEEEEDGSSSHPIDGDPNFFSNGGAVADVRMSVQREWEEVQSRSLRRKYLQDYTCTYEAVKETKRILRRVEVLRGAEEVMLKDMSSSSSSSSFGVKVKRKGKDGIIRDCGWLARSEYHALTLENWESKINWDGYVSDDNHATGKKSKSVAQAILRAPVNTQLMDQYFATNIVDEGRVNVMDFMSLVSWEGADARSGVNEELSKRIGKLILDADNLGKSITHATICDGRDRPLAFKDSQVFSDRLQKEMTNRSVSSTSVFVSSTTPLDANKDELKKIIAEKQKKRERLAKDKASRVLDAIKGLNLGPGKGRSVTSSLMGPGGTERTGRPTRQIATASHYDTENIEHLEIVYNHVFVRADLRTSELRQFHRPRLFGSLVRANKSWHLQIRCAPKGKNMQKIDEGAVISSHASTIRSKADLSPIDGNLVCLEYSEERPPLHLGKGMASRFVNFYRGNKANIPISAGGGDIPIKKRNNRENSENDENVLEYTRPNLLSGPKVFNKGIKDILGLVSHEKKREDDDNKEEKKEESSILPEGVTECLQHNMHGPFLSAIEEGVTQTGIISNLFTAPMFLHKPRSSDFLMILNKKRNNGKNDSGGLNVLLRDFPSSMYCVGQIEPKIKVFGPKTATEKTFVHSFITYQIAKALQRAEYEVEDQGMTFEEINERICANTPMQANALRGRIKVVANYDKNTSIWRIKPLGEDFHGVESAGRKIDPESICAYESACAASRRLKDIGLKDLFTGTNSITNVGTVVTYVNGAFKAAKSRYTSMNKAFNAIKGSKKKKEKLAFEKATELLKEEYMELKRKYEVAKFIYEELQLAPWHLTSEFIDVHKGGLGSGMMILTGIGDPSGRREGFSFIRQAEKPNKGMNTDGALNAQINKITGTNNDLRRLTMKQMADLLRSYGIGDTEIKTLKRWDRVHVIRDLATRAASDGMGDVDGRFFARGEKMKLSDQKEMYLQRIQEIWRRQRQALSTEPSDITVGATTPGDATEDTDDDSDLEEDAFAKDLENEMMDLKKTNEIVQEVTGSTLNKSNKELSGDARDLVVLKREMEEARAIEEGFSKKPSEEEFSPADFDRKVVRRKITRIHADGTCEVVFKFIVSEKEVSKVQTAKAEASSVKPKKTKTSKTIDSLGACRTIGHAVFEDEDDLVSTKRSIEFQVTTRADGKTSKRPYPRAMPKSMPRSKNHGMLKDKKRKRRSIDEKNIYSNERIRTGTSNRRERGAARDRMPHMKFSDRLKEIQVQIEKRPHVTAFLRPVDRRIIPRYYEVISDPIDLSTIRDKNLRCEYRTADAFLDEFELMKNNAIKFNGPTHLLAKEATAIYDFVKDSIEANREEFNDLELAVSVSLSGPKKKKSRKSGGKKKSEKLSPITGNVASMVINGVSTAVPLGDINFDDDSD